MDQKNEAPDIEQERTSDYYQGIIDATRYALDLLGTGRSIEAAELTNTLEGLLYIAEDHRRVWFLEHMAALKPLN